MGRWLSLFVICFFSTAFLVSAAEHTTKGKKTGLPIPRFASLRSSKINIRTGPSERHPIIWVYQRKNYPVEIIAEFENWRKIRDLDGTQGWVHESLLIGKQHALIINNKFVEANQFNAKLPATQVLLYRSPDELSYPLLRAEIGVIGRIVNCKLEWCQLQIEGHKAWIRKVNLWGVR
jgi:SH3-like domain-containing protein